MSAKLLNAKIAFQKLGDDGGQTNLSPAVIHWFLPENENVLQKTHGHI